MEIFCNGAKKNTRHKTVKKKECIWIVPGREMGKKSENNQCVQVFASEANLYIFFLYDYCFIKKERGYCTDCKGLTNKMTNS